MPTATDERRHTNPSMPMESQAQVRVVVAELLQGGREAILEHAGSDYRLRITANGKLILTK